MTKFAVGGSSTLSRFNKLISRGRMVEDQYSGEYFPRSESVINKKTGRRVAKQYDCFIHDEQQEVSKYRGGQKWVRGGAPNA